MKEDDHIDRIAEAGAAWEAAVRSYVRTWGRPNEDGIVTPDEWRSSEAERKARSEYEAARDEYRLHLRGDPHEELQNDAAAPAPPEPQPTRDGGV
jgi:hypothetical protein